QFSLPRSRTGPPVMPGVDVPVGTVPSAVLSPLFSIIGVMRFTFLVKRTLRKRQAFTTAGRLLADYRSDVGERGPPWPGPLGAPAIEDCAVVAHHPAFFGVRDETGAGPVPQRAQGDPEVGRRLLRPHPR